MQPQELEQGQPPMPIPPQLPPEQDAQGEKPPPVPNPPPMDDAKKADFALSRQTLGSIEAEIKELQNSLDEGFAAHYSKNMTEEDRELLMSNPEEALKRYEVSKAQYLEEQLKPKRERMESLKKQIEEEETTHAVKTAEKSFSSKNKGVSVDAIRDFYNNHMTAKEQQEIDGIGDLEEQLNVVYKKMKEKNEKKDSVPFSADKAKSGTSDDTNVGGMNSAFLR